MDGITMGRKSKSITLTDLQHDYPETQTRARTQGDLLLRES